MPEAMIAVWNFQSVEKIYRTRSNNGYSNGADPGSSRVLLHATVGDEN